MDVIFASFSVSKTSIVPGAKSLAAATTARIPAGSNVIPKGSITLNTAILVLVRVSNTWTVPLPRQETHSIVPSGETAALDGNCPIPVSAPVTLLNAISNMATKGFDTE